MIGDALMKYRLYLSLQEAGLPVTVWTEYFQHLQNNDRLAELAWELGINSLLETQPGVNFPMKSKPYADCVEALVAVVAENEEEGVLDDFLSAVGVVPKPVEFRSPVDVYGRMMRRPSELALPADEDAYAGVRLLTPVD
jgi:hypothetical protein